MNHLILAWLITVVVEFFIYLIFVKKDPLVLFIYSLLINSFTLPLATYGYFNLLNNIYLVELIVIFVESLLIKVLLELDYKKALLISSISNLITAAIGFML